MSRTTSIISISLPPGLIAGIGKAARKHSMTRSEFFRNALRVYLEELDAAEALRVYRKERKTRALKTLKGGLTGLMS